MGEVKVTQLGSCWLEYCVNHSYWWRPHNKLCVGHILKLPRHLCILTRMNFLTPLLYLISTGPTTVTVTRAVSLWAITVKDLPWLSLIWPMTLFISSISKRKVIKQAASLSLWLTLHCPLSQKCCHLEADKADDLLWESADYLQPPPSQAATRRWTGENQAHNQDVHCVGQDWWMCTQQSAHSKEISIPQKGWLCRCQKLWGMRGLLHLKRGRVPKRVHRAVLWLEQQILQSVEGPAFQVVETTLKQSQNQVSDFKYLFLKVHICNKSIKRLWKRQYIFVTWSCTLTYFSLYYNTNITN